MQKSAVQLRNHRFIRHDCGKRDTLVGCWSFVIFANTRKQFADIDALAVQVGKRMGARVIAAASTAEKLETCKQHGADLLVNYATEDLKERVKSLTDGAGADVVYDPVGGPHTEAALRATAWNGRVLVIGFAAGDIPRVPTNLVLLKGCSLVGVFWGMALVRERARLMGQMEEILGWVKDGSVKPHVHATYPLERALDALREVEQRRVHGKVVVVP